MAGIKRCHGVEEHEKQEMVKKLKIVEEDPKELRASMLRARYAKIIAKSCEVMKKSEEKARTKGLSENQRRRQEERQAARLALEKVEKSVQFDDSYGVTKELEVLAGCSMSRLGYVGRRRMEKLGLFFKDDLAQFVC